MALDQQDLEAIAGIVDQRIRNAKFGGPQVQVTPSDLTYLGNSQYVSEKTGHVYRKQQGTLVDLGPIPAPI